MRKLLLVASIFIALATTSHAQQKWNLRSLVEYALTNNISVRQADVQKRFDELQLNQSRLSQYPTAMFNTNSGWGWGRARDFATQNIISQSTFSNSFSLNSNVDIFNWFSKRNTIKADEFEAEASRLNVDKIKNDVALNIAASYLTILLSKEQVNIAGVQIGLTAAQLENTRKQVSAGSLPELNAAQFESQLAIDSSNYITAVSNFDQNIILLKALLNLDVAAPFDLETPPADQVPIEPIAELQPEAVYSLAVANLPQQKVNELRIKAAEKRVDAAKGFMYPSLTAGASIGSQYFNLYRDVDPVTGQIKRVSYFRQIDLNLGQNVGIGLNIPIFNGGSLRTNFERSKLNVKNLQLIREADVYRIKQDIYTAYSTALAALEKFKASQKAVETSQRAFDFANKRYSIGLLNTIDLITSQSNLFRAKIDLVSAQYDYVFKMKVLEFYKGQGIKL